MGVWLRKCRTAVTDRPVVKSCIRLASMQSLKGLKARVDRVISHKPKTVKEELVQRNLRHAIDGGTPHIIKMKVHRKQPGEGSTKKETDALHLYDGYHGDAYWAPVYYVSIHVQARRMGKSDEEARQLAWLSVVNLLGVECGYDYGEVINQDTILGLVGEDAEEEEDEVNEGDDDA